MTAVEPDAAFHPDPPADVRQSQRNLRRRWSAIATIFVIAIFTQAVFAGLMLSGVEWARTAHSATAVVLIASSFTAGLVSLVTLHRTPQGFKFGLSLLALAIVVALQTAVGMTAAGGANLMWVHVPLGVALVGFAVQTTAGALRLGGA